MHFWSWQLIVRKSILLEEKFRRTGVTSFSGPESPLELILQLLYDEEIFFVWLHFMRGVSC